MTEIVERDAREMEMLIQTEEEALKGIHDIKKHGLDYQRFYRIMGTLSDDWNILDADVFTVRLTNVFIQRNI